MCMGQFLTHKTLLVQKTGLAIDTGSNSLSIFAQGCSDAAAPILENKQWGVSVTWEPGVRGGGDFVPESSLPDEARVC